MSTRSAYLKISGIKGASVECSHVGWIEVLNVVFQHDSIGAGARGRTAGAISFTKYVDVVTPSLFGGSGLGGTSQRSHPGNDLD